MLMKLRKYVYSVKKRINDFVILGKNHQKNRKIRVFGVKI